MPMSCNRTFARLQVLPLSGLWSLLVSEVCPSERCEFCNSVFRKFTKCLLVHLIHQGGFPAGLNLTPPLDFFVHVAAQVLEF